MRAKRTARSQHNCALRQKQSAYLWMFTEIEAATQDDTDEWRESVAGSLHQVDSFRPGVLSRVLMVHSVAGISWGVIGFVSSERRIDVLP